MRLTSEVERALRTRLFDAPHERWMRILKTRPEAALHPKPGGLVFKENG